jgi:hypothetical protein
LKERERAIHTHTHTHTHTRVCAQTHIFDLCSYRFYLLVYASSSTVVNADAVVAV